MGLGVEISGTFVIEISGTFVIELGIVELRIVTGYLDILLHFHTGTSLHDEMGEEKDKSQHQDIIAFGEKVISTSTLNINISYHPDIGYCRTTDSCDVSTRNLVILLLENFA